MGWVFYWVSENPFSSVMGRVVVWFSGVGRSALGQISYTNGSYILYIYWPELLESSPQSHILFVCLFHFNIILPPTSQVLFGLFTFHVFEMLMSHMLAVSWLVENPRRNVSR
jgi:hypothetical protein